MTCGGMGTNEKLRIFMLKLFKLRSKPGGMQLKLKISILNLVICGLAMLIYTISLR